MKSINLTLKTLRDKIKLQGVLNELKDKPLFKEEVDSIKELLKTSNFRYSYQQITFNVS